MKRRELHEVVDEQIRGSDSMAIRASVQKATDALFEASVTPDEMAVRCEVVSGYLCWIANALRARVKP